MCVCLRQVLPLLCVHLSAVLSALHHHTQALEACELATDLVRHCRHSWLWRRIPLRCVANGHCERCRGRCGCDMQTAPAIAMVRCRAAALLIKWCGLWLQADLLLQSDSADPLLPLVRARSPHLPHSGPSPLGSYAA